MRKGHRTDIRLGDRQSKPDTDTLSHSNSNADSDAHPDAHPDPNTHSNTDS